MGSLIALAMVNCGGGGGGVGGDGVGGDGGEGGEAGGGVSGGGNCGMRCLIKLTALLEETRASSSSLSHEGEIKGLFPNPSLRLYIIPLCVIPNINVFA